MELKGVAGRDSKGEQHQLKELKGVAAKNSKVEHERHLAFACCYTWEMGSKSQKKWTLSKKLTVLIVIYKDVG